MPPLRQSLLYLRYPGQTPVYLSRKVNGLVGRLVTWLGFEPVTSQSVSGSAVKPILIPFGHNVFALGKYDLIVTKFVKEMPC